MGSSLQKIPIFDDQMNDSFVVDMECFPHHLLEKDVSRNSRFSKLQRSLSRKGTFTTTGKKPNPKETYVNSFETSTRGASPDQVTSTPGELRIGMVVAAHHSAPQIHNQITITASDSSASPATQSILTGVRRFSFGRPSSPRSWTAIVDPRRILFVFSTLSSIGTMLLIYFTVSMKFEANDETSAVFLD